MAVQKQIAIVGNGPSRSLYTPFRGDVCLCNIPQIDVPYDYISMVDVKAFKYIKDNDRVFERPILTTEDTARQVKNYNLRTEIQPLFKEKLMNSAATAAYHFAQDYDVIWLYGCDALWSENVSSHQDEIIPRPSRAHNLHSRWREHWKKAWETNKTFVITCPNNTETVDYGKNVKWNKSKI